MIGHDGYTHNMRSRKKLIVTLIIMGLLAVTVLAGWWFFKRRRPGMILANTLEQLTSVPYIAWVEEPREEDKEKSGVTLYNAKLAYKGLNVFNPYEQSIAYLMDMEGNVLHTWQYETEVGWQSIQIKPNGDLLFIEHDDFLGCLDWDSNLKWKSDLRHHHWVDFAEDGDLYTLTGDERWINTRFGSIPIYDEYITILGPTGQLKRKVSLYDVFAPIIPRECLFTIFSRRKFRFKENTEVTQSTVYDILHTNKVDLIKRDIPGLCRAGDVLVSTQRRDFTAIVDMQREAFIWYWGDNELQGPHDATLLDNNNIMIFDNGTTRRYSRLVEVNPFTKQIEWEYTADPPENFFSHAGSCKQILPNGNIMVTEDNQGRVFEITREGQIVWEFFNWGPARTTNAAGPRATLFCMKRLTKIPETWKSHLPAEILASYK